MDAIIPLMPDSAAPQNTPTRATALARVFSPLRAVRPKADLVLHLGQADREASLRSGVPKKRLAVRSDLGILNKYPVDEGLAWTPAKGRLNVLARMAATGRPGVLYPVIRHTAQIDALRAKNFCREFHAGERRSLRDIAAAAAGRDMTAMAAGPQV